ncbi:glycosyl transferase family 1 [Candidatus Saccharibacteria bacterium]|nr:MAG: glycosyl transferase family 1 [Candidatus Saccharibacteria bacterium]PID99173.1 MAG: glycosyl transferase family 1 [Candidatus Saccharibacteria bacterium]
MTKHIVFDARESGTTTGRYMDKLIEHMHKLHPQYQITLLAKPGRVQYLQKLAPNFPVLESDVKEFTFAEQIKLLRQINALRADLVHFPIVQQPILYRGKSVTTMQDLTTIRFRNPAKNLAVFWVKQTVYKWVNRYVARKSIALLAISAHTQHDIATYCRIPLEKITVTHLAADPISDNAEPYKPVAGKQFIVYVGRPLPHKNLGRLLDAFAVLQKTHPELVLVLVGKKDANYARHEERVLREGIQNVVFTDFISEGQLRWLYENCAAYVFPSLSEGFGLPGLEAMVHGAPVVSSSATCLPEVYGDAAEYFDPLSADDIAAKIASVLDNETKRRTLIKKGKRQAAKYSWERTARQTLAVYEKALKPTR